jgi:hypothetical protein
MSASVTAAPAGLAGWTHRWLDALPAPAGALAPVQERGRRALAELPPPSSRQEDWRFTDLGLLLQLPLGSATPAAAAVEPFAAAASATTAAVGPSPVVLRLQLSIPSRISPCRPA